MTLNFRDLAHQMAEKSKEFANHLQLLSKMNNDLRDQSIKILDELNRLVGKVTTTKTCSVCYTRTGDYAVIPCGHGGLCQSCAQRSLDRHRCFVCRGPVDSTVRVFS